MAEKEGDNGDKRLKRKKYEKEMARLQEELCKLQDWVKFKGLRVIVVFGDAMLRERAARFARLRSESARGSSAYRHCLLPPIAKRRRCICNGTCSTSLLRAK